MAGSRSSIPISSIATVLVLLAALVVWSLRGEDPVDDAGAVDPAPEITADPVGSAATADEMRVEITTRVRGRLAAAEAPPACRIRSAGRELPATAELVAGAGTHRLARIALTGDSEIYRVVDLEPDGGITLEVRSDLEVAGRVLDHDGAPLEGAEVWVGAREGGEYPSASADTDGRFSFRGRWGSAGTPVVVTASGKQSWFSTVDTSLPALDVVLRLEPARPVQLQAAMAVDDPASGRFALVPVTREVGLAHYPFFLAVLEPDGLRLDARGALRLLDLPRRGELDVFVVHPRVVVPRAKRIDLLAGADVVPVAAAVAEEVCRGRVVDEAGEPLAGVRVGLRPAGTDPWTRAEGWLLPPEAHLAGAVRVITGPDGGFELGRGDGSSVLTATCPGRFGLELELDAEAALDGDIVLPPATRQPGDEPGLHFLLPPEVGPVRVRVDHGEWVEHRAGERCKVPLAEPALVDVRVRIERSGAEPAEREWSWLAVEGVVELGLE